MSCSRSCGVLNGYDIDPAADQTPAGQRLADAPTSIAPALVPGCE
jgi:hypothetical protein